MASLRTNSVLATVVLLSGCFWDNGGHPQYGSGYSSGLARKPLLANPSAGTLDTVFGDIAIKIDGGATLAVLHGVVLSLQQSGSGQCTAALKATVDNSGWATDHVQYQGASQQWIYVRFVDASGALLQFKWLAIDTAISCDTAGLVLDRVLSPIDCTILAQAKSTELVVQPFPWTSCRPQ